MKQKKNHQYFHQNILVNGAEGIAVGMATNIPTHNLGEVVDAVIAYMDNNNITTEELLQIMPGPDFPTGGIVANKSDLKDIYENGTGKLKLRGKLEFEQQTLLTFQTAQMKTVFVLF